MEQTPSEKSLPRTGVHRFRSRHKKGKVIELQDNSLWEISPGHEMFADHWNQETDITVVPGGYPSYPYDLIDPKQGDRVPARFRGIALEASNWRMLDH
jgi:hypothetical protein